MQFSPSEMLEFINSLQKYDDVKPKIYWIEFPFYTRITGGNQKLCFGYRPEALSHIDTIEQKAWNKHQAHLNRLEQFPLDKAEYYLRMKEVHGVCSIRGLAGMLGEDPSNMVKVLRTLDLPEQIKDFLKSNKNDPATVRFFSLRKLTDIVRKGEERLQLACFREFVKEFEGV